MPPDAICAGFRRGALSQLRKTVTGGTDSSLTIRARSTGARELHNRRRTR